MDNMYLGMASPYMPNGSAPKYIAKHPKANVLRIVCPLLATVCTLKLIWNLQLYEVAAGLRHLAAQKPPIAHGDLKGVCRFLFSDALYLNSANISLVKRFDRSKWPSAYLRLWTITFHEGFQVG